MLKKDTSKLLNPASAIESYFENLLQEPADKVLLSSELKLNSNLFLLTDLEAELSTIENSEPHDSVQYEEGVLKQDDRDNARFKEDCTKTVYADRYKFPLQCLMFNVDNVQLALPLIDMSSVVSKAANLTQLPHRPAWFGGILKHRDKNINVIKLDHLLSIGSQEPDISDLHILIFKDNNWGITCNQLGEVIQLVEEDVKWSGRSANGFTLGTIRKSLASLLDVEKIIDLVVQENS